MKWGRREQGDVVVSVLILGFLHCSASLLPEILPLGMRGRGQTGTFSFYYTGRKGIRECSGVTSSGVGTHSVIPLLCVLRPAPFLGCSFPMHEMGVKHPLTVVRELNETSFGRLKSVGLTACRMSCKVDALRLCENERRP